MSPPHSKHSGKHDARCSHTGCSGKQSAEKGMMLTGSGAEVYNGVLTGTPGRRPRLGAPGTRRQLHRQRYRGLRRWRPRRVPLGTCAVLDNSSRKFFGHLGVFVQVPLLPYDSHAMCRRGALEKQHAQSPKNNSVLCGATRAWEHVSHHQRGDLGRGRACRRLMRKGRRSAARNPVRGSVRVRCPPLGARGAQSRHQAPAGGLAGVVPLHVCAEAPLTGRVHER